MTDILVLKNLSISAGDKSILYQTDLTLEDRKLIMLMGPMGGGKSTLIKFLAGKHDSETFEVSFDKALYRGIELASAARPVVMFQKVREQGDTEAMFAVRQAEIDAAVSTSDGLFCIDEPTAGLSKHGSAKIMKYLSEIARERAVLVVSHNTEEARKYSDHVALIAGGRVVASQPTARFFDMKSNAFAAHFLRTGGLDLPYENTPIQFLSPDSRVTPQGFDSSPADPAPGKENWIIKDLFSLVSLPVDAGGRLETSSLSTRSPPSTVYHFHLSELEIYNPAGEIEKRYTWDQAKNPPDRNLSLSAKICHEIDATILAGKQVTINTTFNQNAGAAILGAYMILNKFSPADALELTAKKFPELHLGMRLEQFLWDMDMELVL